MTDVYIKLKDAISLVEQEDRKAFENALPLAATDIVNALRYNASEYSSPNEELIGELKLLRQYIHANNLEFALLHFAVDQYKCKEN